MRTLFGLLLLPIGLFAQSPQDIVKQAIEDAKKETVGLEKDVTVGKVIKKANGDIEVVYDTPSLGKVAIRESPTTKIRKTPGVTPRTDGCGCGETCDCDDCQCSAIKHKLNAQDTSPAASNNVLFLLNGKEWDVKGHSQACANVAIQQQGGTPVFLNSSKEPIKPPAWYTGKYSLNKPLMTGTKVQDCPNGNCPNQKVSKSFPNPYTTKATAAPSVATNPRRVRALGFNGAMWEDITSMNVLNVGQDGCISG